MNSKSNFPEVSSQNGIMSTQNTTQLGTKKSSSTLNLQLRIKSWNPNEGSRQLSHNPTAPVLKSLRNASNEGNFMQSAHGG